MANNYFLIGFMGAGKSTVGPLLAQRLGWAYVDLDHLIEKRAGMKIASLFKDRGEEYFRNLESEILREVSQGSQTIISLGGGSLLREENRKLVQDSGMCIYLRAGVQTLVERIKQSRGVRPLLETSLDEPVAVRIRVLMKNRKQFYEQAPITIDTDQWSPHQTVAKIVSLIG